VENAEPAESKSWRRLPPDERRRQIIDAAKELFRTNPDASLDEIAERAGCTRQLVSHYFPGGGTGAIFAAIVDDWVALTVKAHSEGIDLAGVGPTRVREATEFVVRTYLQAAKELDQPWLFSDGRDRPGSGIGERWNQTLGVVVEMLLGSVPVSKRTKLARSALRAEVASGNPVVVEMLEGHLSLDEATRVAVEGMVACLEHALPRLSE